jgi:hypothetical protein
VPIVNPNGNGEYWFEGLTFDGIEKTTSPPDLTTGEYWFEGLLVDFLLGAAVPPVVTEKIQIIII